MKRHYTYSIIALLCLLFSSCEWENDEMNYVELERPQAKAIEIKLTDFDDGQTIYVYDKTYVHYTIAPIDETLIEPFYYFDGVRLSPPLDGRIYLSSHYNPDVKGEHILEIRLEYRTETGSIAEKVGLEKYIGVRQFKVRFIGGEDEEEEEEEEPPIENPSLNIYQALDKDNHLVLRWDRPKVPTVTYKIYAQTTLVGDFELIAEFENPTSSKFVDEDYYYGFRQYKIEAYSDPSTICAEEYFTVKYEPISKDHFVFAAQGSKEVSVSFTNPNPYPYTLFLESSSGVVKRINKGETVTFLQKPSEYMFFEAFLAPLNYEGNDYEQFSIIYMSLDPLTK